MAQSKLEKYYCKFNEDKRLLSRHGIVEFTTSMKYIHEYLESKPNATIIDVGAGTGRYCVALAEEGYSVTAVELVKKNLSVLKMKNSKVKAVQGNALNLHKFEDNTFDLTLMFGPMYHLMTRQEKFTALSEAKRITKKGGIIMCAYYMNEYGILVHGFRDGYILDAINNGKIDEDFHIQNETDDLYSFVRLEDIDSLKDELHLKRLNIIASDGPSDYMRKELNAMNDETFNMFIKYHLSVCERPELLGASSHVLDILEK